MNPVVDIRALTKRFGAHVALKGIDLTLDSGEIVGVVGPDGAGKTTLIRTLAGLLEIEASTANVLGFDLREDVTDLKREIGYVPQSFSLHRELSILENLRFTARLHRIPSEVAEPRMEELLERTGLASFRDRPAGALSGGMKQKLAVSNALLPEPRLLLLDEATAGVDVGARAEIWEMLDDARSRALVIISTSYLEEAETCGRLLYLTDGKIIASGSPAHLKESVALDLFRVWTNAPRQLAQTARTLPYVESARPMGGFLRLSVPKGRSLSLSQLRSDLTSQVASEIHLVEQLPMDMESTLLHFAQGSNG